MEDKKPTEQVAPTTCSARGSSSTRRRYDEHLASLKVAAAGEERKPFRAADRERSAPLLRTDRDQIHNTLRAAAEAAIMARWTSFKALRNDALRSVIGALLRHGDFAVGGRVAYPTWKLARTIGKTPSTAERVTRVLRKEWPELVRVILVEANERAWDGSVTTIAHLEYELGDLLRSVALAHGFLQHRSEAPARPERTPSMIRAVMMRAVMMGADLNLALLENKQNLKGEPAPSAHDPLNFEADQSRASSPSLRATEPHPHNTIPDTTRLPGVASAGPPERPSPAVAARLGAHPVTDAVIRQYREAIEGRDADTPIFARERSLVSGALSLLPEGLSDAAVLDVCARIGARALQDSPKRRPPLWYTFGGGGCAPDDPHGHFRRRLAMVLTGNQSITGAPSSPAAAPHRQTRTPSEGPLAGAAGRAVSAVQRASAPPSHGPWHPLTDSVIRRYRETVERKGPRTPISNQERALVSGALAHLDESLSTAETERLLDRVCAIAVRESKKPRPNLSYTFGGDPKRPDEPHLHFLRRLSLIREEDAQRDKDDRSADLAAVFGQRPLAKASPMPAAPRPAPPLRTRHAAPHHATAPRNSPEAPEAEEQRMHQALGRCAPELQRLIEAAASLAFGPPIVSPLARAG